MERMERTVAFGNKTYAMHACICVYVDTNVLIQFNSSRPAGEGESEEKNTPHNMKICVHNVHYHIYVYVCVCVRFFLHLFLYLIQPIANSPY